MEQFQDAAHAKTFLLDTHEKGFKKPFLSTAHGKSFVENV